MTQTPALGDIIRYEVRDPSFKGRYIPSFRTGEVTKVSAKTLTVKHSQGVNRLNIEDLPAHGITVLAGGELLLTKQRSDGSTRPA